MGEVSRRAKDKPSNLPFLQRFKNSTYSLRSSIVTSPIQRTNQRIQRKYHQCEKQSSDYKSDLENSSSPDNDSEDEKKPSSNSSARQPNRVVGTTNAIRNADEMVKEEWLLSASSAATLAPGKFYAFPTVSWYLDNSSPHSQQRYSCLQHTHKFPIYSPDRSSLPPLVRRTRQQVPGRRIQ